MGVPALGCSLLCSKPGQVSSPISPALSNCVCVGGRDLALILSKNLCRIKRVDTWLYSLSAMVMAVFPRILSVLAYFDTFG